MLKNNDGCLLGGSSLFGPVGQSWPSNSFGGMSKSIYIYIYIRVYNMYLCVKINAAIPVYKAIRKSYSNSPHNSKNNSGLPNP